MKIFTLRTQISLPFDHFKNLGCISGKLFGNKAVVFKEGRLEKKALASKENKEVY